MYTSYIPSEWIRCMYDILDFIPLLFPYQMYMSCLYGLTAFAFCWVQNVVRFCIPKGQFISCNVWSDFHVSQFATIICTCVHMYPNIPPLHVHEILLLNPPFPQKCSPFAMTMSCWFVNVSFPLWMSHVYPGSSYINVYMK